MKRDVTPAETSKGIVLPSGARHELTLTTHIVGSRPPLVFRRFKSFPGPSGLGVMRRVVERLAARPTSQLVVLGHSDKFGAAAPNEQLSRARAEATVALLSSDAAFFSAQFKLADEDGAWGVMEVADMLDAIDAVDGFAAQSTDPVGSFQAKSGLSRTGTLDEATINRVVEAYLGLLGPNRPAKSRLHPLGGGANQPVLPLGSSEQVSEDDTSPQFVHPRRVELFIFEDLVMPSIESFKEGSSQLEPTYQKWCSSCAEVIAPETGTLEVRVRDRNGLALAGRRLELLAQSNDSESDEVRIIATVTADERGVARFPGAIGLFTVRVVGTSFEDELLVSAKAGLANRYQLDTLLPGPAA